MLLLLLACTPAPVINNYYIIQEDTGQDGGDDTAKDSQADDTGDSDSADSDSAEDSAGDSGEDSQTHSDTDSAEDSDDSQAGHSAEDSAGDSGDDSGHDSTQDSSDDSAEDSVGDSGEDSQAQDSAGDSAEDSSSTDSGGDSGDSGTAPTCDYTTPATIVGADYSCTNDVWTAGWELAGMPGYVHVDVDITTAAHSMTGELRSERGDFVADCCSGGTSQIFYGEPCAGTTFVATVTVYDTSGNQVDCATFGNGWASSGCSYLAATPLTCTP